MAFEQGDYSQTLRLIERAEELGDGDFEAALLAAECYRYYGLRPEFEKRISEARSLRQSNPKIAAHEVLFDTHQGKFDGTPAHQLRTLEALETPEHIAVEAVVVGSLATGRSENLRSLVDRLAEAPKTLATRRSYLEGRLLLANGRRQEAAAQLRQVLSQSPGFEMAWLALAEVYGTGALADVAKETAVLEEMGSRFPRNPLVAGKLAKVLRTQGRSSFAANQLEKLPTTHLDPWEQIELDLDRGNYAACVSRLEQIGMSTPQAFELSVDRIFRAILAGEKSEPDNAMRRLQLASLALALNEQHEAARELKTLELDRVARIRRIADLRTIRALAPNERIVEQMLKNVEDLSQPVLLNAKPKPTSSKDMVQYANEMGSKIYLTHCAQCHGEEGDGLGRASRHLAPAARSFTGEPMRYVSSERARATDRDLTKTIVEGLRGTSMPGFPQLNSEEVQALILQMRHFQRLGLQRRYAADHPGSTDLQVLTDSIDERLNPGAELEVPDIPASNAELIRTGKQLFQTLACNLCHRESESATRRRFVDSLGRTIFARDFSNESLRGSRNTDELYKRIILGMPGTPHPALSGTDTPDVAALIHYVLSMAPDESRTTNYERAFLPSVRISN